MLPSKSKVSATSIIVSILVQALSYTLSVGTKLDNIVLLHVNLDSGPLNESLWEREGFETANATQISKNLGKSEISPSTLFLMARKPGKLRTVLRNFEHNSLSIKYSSLIGRRVESPLAMPAAVTSTTSPAPTPASSSTTLIKVDSTPAKGPEIIQITLNSDQAKESGDRRKRRELDSREISQIHQLIKVANAKAKDKEELGPAPDNLPKTKPAEIPAPLVPVPEPKSIPGPEAGPGDHEHDDSRLTYKAWRNSKLNKDFRPPGFYLLVDDQVIFDNWEGFWAHPNIIGKVSLNSTTKIWNETDLLIRWDEVPNRDIKISFEWEPMDTTSFFFLDDISVGTLIASKTGPPGGTKDTSQALPALNQNKNITLYIVVKGHESEVAASGAEGLSIRAGDSANPTKATSTAKSVPLSTTTPTSAPATAPPVPVGVSGSVAGGNGLIEKKALRPVISLTPVGPDITAIVVLVVVVTLCVAILCMLAFNGIRRGQRRRGRC